MVKKLSISLLVLLILAGLALQPAAVIVKGQYPVPYKLTIQVNNHLAGTTSPSPGVTYVDYGLSVQVKAIPHTGYIFNGWYLNGVYQNKLTTITITMLHDNLLMAAFSQEAVALTITANPPEGGVINPPPGTLQYQYGSVVEVTAQPNQDYVFNGWYLDGQYIGTQSTITVEMTNNRELGAFFAGGSTPSEPPVELPPSTITVSCESYSKYSEFDVKINGDLTASGTPIANAGVLIYLSVTGGESWDILSFVNTDTNGEFSVTWKPSVTGTFLLNVTWAGNTQYAGTNAVVNFAVTPYEEQSVFSVASNSTLSGLMFNSETKELGFTVTGPTGTTGFTNVIIPKSLLSDISTLAVYVDETEMNYSAESQDDTWDIFFTYEHSTHQVVLNLQTEPTQTTEPEPEEQDQEQESFFETPIGLATIVGALVAAAVAVTVLVMRRRQNSIQQK